VVTDDGLELFELEDDEPVSPELELFELVSLELVFEPELESSFALVVVDDVVVVVVVAPFEFADATVVVLLPSAGSWPSTICT
jgi:hypothetical protein